MIGGSTEMRLARATTRSICSCMRSVISALAFVLSVQSATALPGLSCVLKDERGNDGSSETRILEINPSRRTAQIYFGPLGPIHADAYESEGTLAFSFWRHDGSGASISVSRQKDMQGFPSTFADYGPGAVTPRWIKTGWCKPFDADL